MTIPDRAAIIKINEKSKIAYVGTQKTKTGEKKINSETVESDISNMANIEMDNARYFLWEYTLFSTSLCNMIQNV